jgi:hypothetical protein
MSNAKYIGRVGGLAVALGVGIAVATTPGGVGRRPGEFEGPARQALPGR